MKIIIYSALLLMTNSLYPESAPPGAFSITRIHYDGGGDWYADPSSLPNILQFLKDQTNIIVNPLLNFESAQAGFGMYTKYWLASFLAVFAISMLLQFTSYFFESIADYNREPGYREIHAISEH